ncbi:MAG: hypothetical protein HON77_19635 [Gammaproteobacteria bacterium]|jgi:hypothetical protein|nr:hypothetical protein [Gammaproteobacteria bacterium]MDG1234325.1 hypothetical protein [Pseudomonadales bacterium]MBT5155047.1 hypothetical protein [Gammaproteobacteria bacterium]MBT5685911.1 hypothetical protein [Gammaproteobacteria bacterium]MBT5725354.1 hypothetical protein [Gammaproteobacteria bacterium]
MDFQQLVRNEITMPIVELCETMLEEGEMEQHAFFQGLLPLLAEPDREEMVLAAVIELSKCAFLGFNYSPLVAMRIDQLLERSIDLAHTMSADGMN